MRNLVSMILAVSVDFHCVCHVLDSIACACTHDLHVISEGTDRNISSLTSLRPIVVAINGPKRGAHIDSLL